MRPGRDPDPRSGWERLEAPDAEVALARTFIARRSASALLQTLIDSIAWRDDAVVVFGRRHPIPRRHQWIGDRGATYRWSGLCMDPVPWPPSIERLRRRVERVTGARFNAVLVNLYRDGRDAMGWHADDEPELGPEPTIASVSLGAERDFVLRHRARADLPKLSVPLPHGSLLVMRGPTQRHWQHALPRRRRVVDPRINLTFRAVLAEG